MIDWLDDREQYWISYYDSFNTGYNLTMGGLGPRGFTVLKGKKRSKEFCDTVAKTTLEAMQRDDVKANHKAGLERARTQGKLAHNKGRTYVTKGNVLRFVFPEEAERLIKEEGYIKGHIKNGNTMSDVISAKYNEDTDYRKRVSKGVKKAMWKPKTRRKYLLGIAKRFGSLALYKEGLYVKFSFEEVNQRLDEGWEPYKEYTDNNGLMPCQEGIITNDGTIKRKEGQ